MNLEEEMRNQFDLIDTGATLQVHRGDDGMIRARANPMPYLRSPMRQAEPQSPEQTVEELPAVVGGLAGGATAATVGLPGDIAGLAAGAYKALFPDEGEGRLEAFTNTLSEISDKYGSGAVKGYLRDQAEQVGASDVQMEALEEAMTVGEFGGVGGIAKGVVTKGPQMLSKAGDVIEGAGEAAKARGGAVLNSGLNPDPLIAAAGDAVAKFRAPTEKQPGVIAFHGSGADFDEFSLEKIGTGEGAQAYGYGLYFAEKEDIARFYKEAMEEPKYLELEGKPLDSVYTADNEEKFADYVNRNFDPEEHDDVYIVLDNLGQGLFSLDDADALSQSTFRQGAQKQIYQKIKQDLVEPEVGEGKMYKVGLEPKPEDMMDYQLPIAGQDPKFLKAFKEVYHDRIKSDPQLSKLYPTPDSLTMKDIGLFDKSIVGQAYNTFAKELFNGDEAALTQALLEKGVSGIKYRDAGSRGGAKSLKDASFNYVIFDDKMIKILEKYGIVGPVAITGIAASQQEGEGDGRSA